MTACTQSESGPSFVFRRHLPSILENAKSNLPMRLLFEVGMTVLSYFAVFVKAVVFFLPPPVTHVASREHPGRKRQSFYKTRSRGLDLILAVHP